MRVAKHLLVASEFGPCGLSCPTRLRRAPRHKVRPGWAVQCGGCDWLGEPRTWPTTTTRLADPGRGAACQGTRAPSLRGSGTTCVRSLRGRWACPERQGHARGSRCPSTRRHLQALKLNARVLPRLAAMPQCAAMAPVTVSSARRAPGAVVTT